MLFSILPELEIGNLVTADGGIIEHPTVLRAAKMLVIPAVVSNGIDIAAAAVHNEAAVSPAADGADLVFIGGNAPFIGIPPSVSRRKA